VNDSGAPEEVSQALASLNLKESRPEDFKPDSHSKSAPVAAAADTAVKGAVAVAAPEVVVEGNGSKA
jgi:hypothetical protein